MERRLALLVKDEATGEMVPLRLYNGKLLVKLDSERTAIETRTTRARIPPDDKSAVLLGAESRKHENVLPVEADKDGALLLVLSGDLTGLSSFAAHHTRHENGGADEISVEDLSGELADDQPPKQHGLSDAAKHSSTAVENDIFTADANGLPKDSGEQITATPAASKVVKSDAGGTVDGWVSDATTSVKGKVELATDGENAASVAVQGNDSRLALALNRYDDSLLVAFLLGAA